jgi:hypothetical protein
MTVTTLAYTGAGPQTYTVPAGVVSVKIECWGAAGGAGSSFGGYATGIYVVAPATVLNVYVGGTTTNNVGGFNGGGHGGFGYGGGGASDVRLGVTLASRIIVGGGGGGNGTSGANGGGYGGGTNGRNGIGGSINAPGGTQTSGNALGYGGDVASGGNAGGGGGGYWGGGAGRGAGGGGGGSGFLATGLFAKSMQNGVRNGNGQVTITALNTAPLAPTLTALPVNIVASVPNVLAWRFNDNDAGDSQSRADVRSKVNGAGTWTTVTSAATTAQSYTLPASTWATGSVEWQVACWDFNSAAGPWSASGFVGTVAAVPAPTITSPATDGLDQLVTPVEVDWTLPTGWTQEAYWVLRGSAAGLSDYFDSGVVVSAALYAMVPLDPISGRTDYLTLTFRSGGNWSVAASRTVVGQIAPPMVPVVFLAQTPGLPEVVATIINPAGSGGFSDTLVTDLYRTSPDNTTTRIAANLANNSVVTDLLPTGGVNEYLAKAFAANASFAISATDDASAYADVYSDTY